MTCVRLALAAELVTLAGRLRLEEVRVGRRGRFAGALGAAVRAWNLTVHAECGF